MATVHVVSGFYTYEGARVICVYATKAGADAFVARCKAHEERKPASPDDRCTDAESDKWWAEQMAWQNSHPAGEDNWLFDGYVVNEMRVCVGEEGPSQAAPAAASTKESEHG